MLSPDIHFLPSLSLHTHDMVAAANHPPLFDRASVSQHPAPLTGVDPCLRTRIGSLLRVCLVRKWALAAYRREDLTPLSHAAAEANLGPPVADPEHLIIMVNGINGSASDWSYGAKQFEKLGDKVLIRCSTCNYAGLTFNGIDTMGSRLAKEVKDIVRDRPSLIKISFVAHSLGGLVARYAIAELYTTDRIAGLEPINFVTVATPHLGSQGNEQLPFLCGLPFLERRASQTAHLIVGRSGRHLFLTDTENNNNNEPLLLRMVNDLADLKFISALKVFKRRVAYANVYFDHMVGWRSSSIRRKCELPKPNVLVPDEKYPHIVYVEQDHRDDIREKVNSPIEDPEDEVEEKMIRGLTQVHWERVDVYFQKGWQRFIAHNTIQVKRNWLKDGADVVEHIRDNLIL